MTVLLQKVSSVKFWAQRDVEKVSFTRAQRDRDGEQRKSRAFLFFGSGNDTVQTKQTKLLLLLISQGKQRFEKNVSESSFVVSLNVKS